MLTASYQAVYYFLFFNLVICWVLRYFRGIMTPEQRKANQARRVKYITDRAELKNRGRPKTAGNQGGYVCEHGVPHDEYEYCRICLQKAMSHGS